MCKLFNASIFTIFSLPESTAMAEFVLSNCDIGIWLFQFHFQIQMGEKYKFAVRCEIHDRTETNFAHQEIKLN
jgi:hypothetical protein